jgi:hypothetical protein
VPTIGEVKWGSDNPIEAAPVLSDEEVDTLKKRMAAMDKLLADQERSPMRPYPGALSLWESGTKLHGGGDEKVYECPSADNHGPPCLGIIGGSAQGYGHLVCPTCQKVWKGTQVVGERLARLTDQGWSTLIYRYFVRLGHNADIYMKHPRVDIRKVSGLEQAKQLQGHLRLLPRLSLGLM